MSSLPTARRMVLGPLALLLASIAGAASAQTVDPATMVLRMWTGGGGSAAPATVATPASRPTDGALDAGEQEVRAMPVRFADLAAELGIEDRRRSIDCLAAAIHYEAGNESLAGRRAVAEVVLNRVRRPGYPKSVCAVVFQGWRRTTGCQFTFTCDGSLRRRPSAASWRAAVTVAEKVLDGAQPRGVADATNYHADYVRPYWSPSLVKITQIGAHIFYRPRGPNAPAPGMDLALAGTDAPQPPLWRPRPASTLVAATSSPSLQAWGLSLTPPLETPAPAW